jgi:uncharacterized membrane protein
MPWWAPVAIIGGAIVGAVMAVLLLLGTPSAGARQSRGRQRLAYEETDNTNYAKWSPVAFLVIGSILAVIVGLSIGLSVG